MVIARGQTTIWVCRDGADGVTYYTWIAYSDNPDGNPLYDKPRASTKYIGIAYNKEEQTPSKNPADYTWSNFKGEQGPPGEGMSPLGEWYDGLHVPRLGVVTMDGKAFTAHRATDNPPMWTVTDHDGRHIVTKQGYILTGEMNTDDYYLIVPPGEPGKDGCVIRDSEWAPGVEYRNDSSIDAPIRYIDVVLVRNDSTASGYDAYRCLRTHVSSPSLDYTFTDFWEKFGSNVGAIFTSLIVAKNAMIRFLAGNELRIEKPDGTVTAGIRGGSDNGDKVRIWAGSADPNKAPFRVDEDGSMVAMKGEFGGNLKAVTGTFNDIRSASEDAPTSNKKEMWLNRDRLRFVDGTKVSALFGTAVMNIMSGIEKCGISVTINGGGNSSLGMCGAYIDVKGAGQGFDNFALRIPHGQISGFRPGTRRINTSVTLREMDSIVYCGNMQDITVSMPYNAEDGQMYFIRKVNTGRVFISANKIQGWGSENTTRFELASQHLAIMMYDAVSRWWTVNIVKSGW